METTTPLPLYFGVSSSSQSRGGRGFSRHSGPEMARALGEDLKAKQAPLRFHACLLLLGVAPFLLGAYPFRFHLGTRAFDDGDSLLNSWVLAWDARALFDPHLSAWNAPMFYPSPGTFDFGDNLFGVLWVSLPVQWLTGNPILAAYGVGLVAFVLCFYTCALLAVIVWWSWSNRLKVCWWVNALPLGIFYMRRVVQARSKDLLYFGGDIGFVHDTVGSLVRSSFYDRSVSTGLVQLVSGALALLVLLLAYKRQGSHIV